jgi:hypothetical protein
VLQWRAVKVLSGLGDDENETPNDERLTMCDTSHGAMEKWSVGFSILHHSKTPRARIHKKKSIQV